MKIDIDWQHPIKLTKSKSVLIAPDSIPEEIPNLPGVYYFSRRYGASFTPFYIGETRDLKARLKKHLESTKIYHVLEGHKSTSIKIRQGTRYFHYGIFRPKQNQDAKKCILIVQRLMIRQAVDKGLFVLNDKLTKIKTDEISFSGDKQGRGWYEKNYKPESR
jgi:hypothetical protein